MQRVRLSGLGTYVKDTACVQCGAGIIVKGEAVTPIFYAAQDGRTYCVDCAAALKNEAYAALDKHNHSIVTVLAIDPLEADAMVERELNLNPSRKAYYKWWDAAGRKLRTDDGAVMTRPPAI